MNDLEDKLKLTEAALDYFSSFAILDYCGLPAEPGCFRFYESEWPVLTPSASQVRNPMTARSVGSGLKYEKCIKTSIPALAEIKRKAREVLGV